MKRFARKKLILTAGHLFYSLFWNQVNGRHFYRQILGKSNAVDVGKGTSLVDVFDIN